MSNIPVQLRPPLLLLSFHLSFSALIFACDAVPNGNPGNAISNRLLLPESAPDGAGAQELGSSLPSQPVPVSPGPASTLVDSAPASPLVDSLTTSVTNYVNTLMSPPAPGSPLVDSTTTSPIADSPTSSPPNDVDALMSPIVDSLRSSLSNIVGTLMSPPAPGSPLVDSTTSSLPNNADTLMSPTASPESPTDVPSAPGPAANPNGNRTKIWYNR